MVAGRLSLQYLPTRTHASLFDGAQEGFVLPNTLKEAMAAARFWASVCMRARLWLFLRIVLPSWAIVVLWGCGNELARVDGSLPVVYSGIRSQYVCSGSSSKCAV